MSLIKDNVYIVTGASRGYGLAITKMLLDNGAKVGMVARNRAKLLEVADAFGTDVLHCVNCDIAVKSDVDRALQEIKLHFGRLNGVINNAGLAFPSPIASLGEAEVASQVNTNFIGTVFCCQKAIELLTGEDNPRIVNISSASAWHYDEISHLSIYAATKAAVERFTRDLAHEVQPLDIGVTCIRPGGAMTDFSNGWDSERMVEAIRAWADWGPTINMGMDVDDVAQAVVHVLGYKPGVAVDLLEVRPKRRIQKPQL